MMGNTGPFLVDVAVNLTDCVFRGINWKGRRVRPDDFVDVLQRAMRHNVRKMIITGTSLAQCHDAIRLCASDPSDALRCTIGVHPSHGAEFAHPIDPPASSDGAVAADVCAARRMNALRALAAEHRGVVVAVGEMGLDYAELAQCPRAAQQSAFVRQLRGLRELRLPFLLHSRDCGVEFVEILEAERRVWPREVPFVAVVHSFNGPPEEQRRLLDMDGVYFSLNGSAFRERQVAEQVCQIPLNRVMLETDAPWCGIRATHYGAQFVRTQFDTSPKSGPFVGGTCVEGRVEPCHLQQVLEAYTGALRALGEVNGDEKMRHITEAEVMQQVYANCLKVFPNL